MRVGYYILLWVMPAAGNESPPLKQLDDVLGPIFAHVMWGTSLERKGTGQTAIRLFGAADEAQVTGQLATCKYEIVGREERSTMRIHLR